MIMGPTYFTTMMPVICEKLAVFCEVLQFLHSLIHIFWLIFFVLLSTFPPLFMQISVTTNRNHLLSGYLLLDWQNSSWTEHHVYASPKTTQHWFMSKCNMGMNSSLSGIGRRRIKYIWWNQHKNQWPSTQSAMEDNDTAISKCAKLNQQAVW